MTVFVVTDTLHNRIAAVFSTEERAEDWIRKTKRPEDYEIEPIVTDYSYGEIQP